MTELTFRPAVQENMQLLISLAGGTGSGKTYSALLLASGLAPTGKIAGICTENGRMKHYAKAFKFDMMELHAPFSPSRYAQAIMAADKLGYEVIVVDSTSHEHAGDGGILDMHEAELDRMAGDNWQKREACKMAAWIKPKMEHKEFVSKLLQVKAHVILCFRAEQKIEIAREDNKTVIREKKSPVGAEGWMPVSEKTLPYEMTMSFLLKAEKPGIPIAIKLQQQHRGLVSLEHPLTEATGKALARWARGDQATDAPKSEERPKANLQAILTAFKIAGTMAELQKAGEAAKNLSDDNKPLAKIAYAEAQARLIIPAKT